MAAWSGSGPCDLLKNQQDESFHPSSLFPVFPRSSPSQTQLLNFWESNNEFSLVVNVILCSLYCSTLCSSAFRKLYFDLYI